MSSITNESHLNARHSFKLFSISMELNFIKICFFDLIGMMRKKQKQRGTLKKNREQPSKDTSSIVTDT